MQDGDATRSTPEGVSNRRTQDRASDRSTHEATANWRTGEAEGEGDPDRSRAEATPDRTRWTVLELRRLSSDEWRATQAGAEHVGRGPTAAAAAAAYCRRVGDGLDGGADRSTHDGDR
ncbi:MAG: hypothetical protein V5A43_09000 [Haloarculaceae archaeon]